MAKMIRVHRRLHVCSDSVESLLWLGKDPQRVLAITMKSGKIFSVPHDLDKDRDMERVEKEIVDAINLDYRHPWWGVDWRRGGGAGGQVR